MIKTKRELKIRIDQDDVSTKLWDTLRDRQWNKHARTIESYDLINAAKKAETRLERFGVPKCDRKGAIYVVSEGGLGTDTYGGWRRDSSIAWIERGKTDWFLIALNRESFYPRNGSVAKIYLTEHQEARALDKFRRQYGQVNDNYPIMKEEVA